MHKFYKDKCLEQKIQNGHCNNEQVIKTTLM